MKSPSVSLTVSASHPAWVCTPAAQAAVDRFDFLALASVRPTTVPCLRFDVRERLVVHSRCSAVGLAVFVGIGQNISPIHLVVQRMETKAPTALLPPLPPRLLL